MQINIAILENASPTVEAEMFARMNNGQAVSRTDIAICKNDSSIAFDTLGKHEIFNVMLRKKRNRVEEVSFYYCKNVYRFNK